LITTIEIAQPTTGIESTKKEHLKVKGTETRRLNTTMRSLFPIFLTLQAINVTFSFGFSGTPMLKSTSSCRSTFLHAKKKESDTSNRPQNEFSRPINVDAVLMPRRRRNYVTSIEAKSTELSDLSERFHLPSIAKLEAELTLLIDSPGRRRTGTSGSSDDTLYVEGTIESSLTQTCVRTNEDFEVDLQLNFFAAVRAISWSDREVLDNLFDDRGGMEDSKSSNYQSRGVNKSKKKKRERGNANKQQGRNLDDLGMMELQNLMTDLDYFERDEENDLIEDDAVYKDGILDGGELVAQIFRSKLDPYPKKPGSEPVKMSIQG